MANQKHLDILKEGVKVWNEWREGHPIGRPNLSYAELTGIDLDRINLSGSVLHCANLSNSRLAHADLTIGIVNAPRPLGGSLPAPAELNNAILIGTNFFKTNLSDAD